MFVTAIRTEGLRCAVDVERTGLDRVVDLGRGPEGVALADALTLFAASLDHRRVADALTALGVASGADPVEVIEEHGLPVQASTGSGDGWPPLVDVGSDRTVKIALELSPDPPMFGDLRELAVRDTRLIGALSKGPSLRVKVGWVLSNDLRVASIGLLDVRVGDAAFPLSGSERPSWLPGLLRKVSARFGRVDGREPIEAVTRRLLDASLSPDPTLRAAFHRAADALAGRPFGLGRLELVRAGQDVHLCFGERLLRARQFGPAAEEAVRLVDAVYVRAPDVLVVEAPGACQARPKAVRDWLASATTGSGATLEQVLVAPGGAA